MIHRACLLLLVLSVPFFAQSLGLNFETLSDGEILTGQYPGLIFSNAAVLTSGLSLNEREFPPHSGAKVAFDNGGPITILFSKPVFSFGGCFTYVKPVTTAAFDAAGNKVASVASASSANSAFSPNPNPNEFLQIVAKTGISKVTITGDAAGSSFALDDVVVSYDYPKPAVNDGGIVNAGGFVSGPVAPGSIISIFGVNLSGASGPAAQVPLPTRLSGTSVTINDVAAPLFYVSPVQINAQVPFETLPGKALLVVSRDSQSSASLEFQVVDGGPGIFVQENRAAALNQDNTVNGPQNPAKVGSAVVLFFTGGGLLDQAIETGAAAPFSALLRPRLAVTATIGGKPAVVQFAGLTPGFVGLLQANLEVPDLTSGDWSVIINIGGKASNAAMIAVSQ